MKHHLPAPKTSFLALALLAVASGCGGGSDNGSSGGGGGSGGGSYQYQLIENGCDTGKRSFSSKSDYCSALEDSAKNNGCALSLREEQFQKDCGGDFQEVNGPAAPPPAPQPQPAPHPTPSPLEPKARQDLEAAGFTFKIDSSHQVLLPGEKPFYEKLQAFWTALESAEDVVIAHKDLFQVITVHDFAATFPNGKEIWLDVDMNAIDIRSFYGAVDRVADLRAATGVSLDVGAISYAPSMNQGTKSLEARLAFAESYAKDVAPMVKELSFSTTTMYDAYDRKLELNDEKYQSEFASMTKVLIPAAPCFRLLDSLGVALSGSLIFNSPTDADAQKFAAVTLALGKEGAALKALVDAGALKTIEADSGENGFYPSSQTLDVANQSGPALSAFHGVLAGLAEQVPFAKSTGIGFEYGYNGLGADFVTASQHLSPLLSALRAKAKLVRSIEFGDKSSFEYESLTVGTKDSAADLRKVVDGIK